MDYNISQGKFYAHLSAFDAAKNRDKQGGVIDSDSIHFVTKTHQMVALQTLLIISYCQVVSHKVTEMEGKNDSC